MKVTLGSQTPFNIRLKTSPEKINVITSIGGTQVPASFKDLSDFDNTNISDKYVIMYDASTQKYKTVNPDDVLLASSTTETTQPGLPSDFVNTLDVDLDDRIDLDAGSF